MIKGRLSAKANDGAIRVYFIQRGDDGKDANGPVKVYRRLADDINFSYGLCGDTPGNWTEYIDNQSLEDARVQLVYEGILPYENSFSYYMDRDVKIGHTYLYWVAQETCDISLRIGPTACKLRDTEVWWNYERTVREMDRLRIDFHPLVAVVPYGESTMHRTMYGLEIGNPERAVLLAGAIHASEPGGELILKALRFVLETRPELVHKVGFRVLPVVNVDIRELTVEGEPFYLRKNPNGVDLNRNFDWLWREEFIYGFSNADPDSTTYHGPFPASENETKAAIRFVEECPNPVALFVYDSGSVITEDWLLFSSSPAESSWERDNELANIYSRPFRADHPGCGTFTAEPMHYPRELMECFEETGQPHGTFEGWAHAVHNIPAYSLQGAGSKEGSVNDQDNVTFELLEMWARRHAYALIAILEEFSK